jgi:hypothetical protein
LITITLTTKKQKLIKKQAINNKVPRAEKKKQVLAEIMNNILIVVCKKKFHRGKQLNRNKIY